jgi:DNA invertase Pin-like site-specific DNA recombinase
MLACARPRDMIVVPDLARIVRDFDEVSSLLHDRAEQGISVRTA